METGRAADGDKDRILAGVSTKSLSSVNAPIRTTLRQWQGKALSPAEYDKAINVVKVCNEDHDIETLITLASSRYGLVNDEVRRKACMCHFFQIIISCLTFQSRAHSLELLASIQERVTHFERLDIFAST